MTIKDIKVAIIGAGPVGLTMARLLQQGGVQVTVYERDLNAQARIWGGTLDLHRESGQEALEKAGLLEQYYALALPMGIKFADQNGLVFSTRPVTPEGRYNNPEINRNVLRKMLLDSLLPGTVEWNRKLRGLETANGKWKLVFAQDKTASSDLVIVANGGMSKVRSFVTDARVVETGTFIVQGDVPSPEINLPDFYRLCDGHRLMVAHEGTLLVVNPENNGSLTYGLIFEKPEAWGDANQVDFQKKPAAMAYLLEKLKDWSGMYLDLISATTQFVGLVTRVLPLDQPWKQQRPLPVTLIGDAAHLMPPFAGMGVNIGLQDALRLSENLLHGTFDSMEAAIEDYERRMFVYASAASRASQDNELEMRSPDFEFRKLIS